MSYTALRSIVCSGGFVLSGTAITFVEGEVPTGTINGTNPTFNVAHTPLGGVISLYTNGLLLTVGNDYTLSGQTITFLSGAIPQTTDTITASYAY